jgi:effector-binding domain-containing protein
MSGPIAEQSQPELVTVPPVTTAVVSGRISDEDLRNFFDSSFSTLATTLSTQRVGIAGPAFGLFRDAPDGITDLDVGFPTDGAVQPDGDVAPSSLPGGRVVRLVHYGAFDRLGDSWRRLHAWVEEQGLTVRPVRWEVYVTEPSPDMDPRDLRTELNAPVED